MTLRLPSLLRHLILSAASLAYLFPFIWMLGLIGAAGLIWFLLGRRKKHVPAYPEPEQIRRPEGRAEAMMRQKLGGF